MTGETLKQDLVKWLRDWFDNNGKNCNAIIGISGGKDSSVVAALCVEALGKDKVIGVMMPDGEQSDIQDSYKLVKYLGIRYITININKTKGALFDAMLFQQDGNFKIENITEQAIQNLPPRIRMSTLYLVAQCMNGRVLNTCNLSETLLGWETRWGDAVGDVAPLADLTVQEVKKLGHALKLPNELVEKIPADGLCGSSDEEKMGIKYKVLDDYIRYGHVGNNSEMISKINERIKNNLFKHKPIPYYHCPENNFITSKFGLL